ncbi:MAG: hypothetical protein ACT4PJ_09490 [Gemmatimonadaceae bacterium]
MEIRDVRIEDSGVGKDRVRLRADVKYESGPGEEYWFDVPAAHAGELSTSGNPWLACLLPLATHVGEPLRLPLPVDWCLLENASQLVRIWRAWYPRLRDVRIEAEGTDPGGDAPPVRVAAFFSGGVDSFFTTLRCREVAAPAERADIDELITVWGLDVPLTRRDAFGRLSARNAKAASELGKAYIDVATNLRTTRWGSTPWAYLSHGAALASVALSLERRYRTVYIAGSGSYRDLHPWGSHWVTDPLFSTSLTHFVFDAGAYLRTEKIEQLASHPAALRTLHICFETESDENCGTCGKCQRTMLVLHLCGALEQCEAFPSRSIDLRRIARMDCSHPFAFREAEDIRTLAESKGRSDVVKALDRAMARGLRARRVAAGVGAIRRPLGSLLRRMRGTQ